jgi:hypothetical protein
MSGETSYSRPTIVTLSAGSVVEALGPAVAIYGDCTDGGGGRGFDGHRWWAWWWRH